MRLSLASKVTIIIEATDALMTLYWLVVLGGEEMNTLLRLFGGNLYFFYLAKVIGTVFGVCLIELFYSIAKYLDMQKLIDRVAIKAIWLLPAFAAYPIFWNIYVLFNYWRIL